MPFGDDVLGPEDTIPPNDGYFNMQDSFEDQFGSDAQASYQPGASIDDDSDFSHLLDS